MAEELKPKTRREQFYQKIIDAAGGSGEGGNPNYIEIIEGTLENPWGNYEYSEIYNGIYNNKMTVLLDGTILELNSFDVPMYVSAIIVPYSGGETLLKGYKADSYYESVDKAEAVCAYWQKSGFLGCYKMRSNKVLEILGSAPITVTIIHHPIP